MLSACPIHVVPTTVSVGDETEAISARLLQRVAMFHGVTMYDAGLNVGCTASGTVLTVVLTDNPSHQLLSRHPWLDLPVIIS